MNDLEWLAIAIIMLFVIAIFSICVLYTVTYFCNKRSKDDIYLEIA